VGGEVILDKKADVDGSAGVVDWSVGAAVVAVVAEDEGGRGVLPAVVVAAVVLMVTSIKTFVTRR
jgi:hypothetical protein